MARKKKVTGEREEFSRWVENEVHKAGGYRQAAEQSGVVHATLIRAVQGEPLALNTLEGISRWTRVSLSKLLRMYGADVEDDRGVEFAIARVLDQRPELREVLEEAVDVLNDDEMSNVLDYIRFQIEQAKRRG